METGKKHPLLVYRMRYRRFRGLYFSVAIAVFALYGALRVLPPETWGPFVGINQFEWLLPLVGLAVLGYAIFRLIAGSIPFVQCTERNIIIQAPLYRVVFSYRRLRETRPNSLARLFENVHLSSGSRKVVFDEQYSGYTAILVVLDSWPLSARALRFWLGDLVFSPGNGGLVLWVEDWMTLNRELSDYKDRWRQRRKQSQQGDPEASLYRQVVTTPAKKKKK